MGIRSRVKIYAYAACTTQWHVIEFSQGSFVVESLLKDEREKAVTRRYNFAISGQSIHVELHLETFRQFVHCTSYISNAKSQKTKMMGIHPIPPSRPCPRSRSNNTCTLYKSLQYTISQQNQSIPSRPEARTNVGYDAQWLSET